MRLLGIFLFGSYYLTTTSTSNMEMQFGYSFQVNDGLVVYQVYKEKPHHFSNITLEMPYNAFNDKTIDINEWDEDINSYYLARLASTSNKFFLPTI